MTKLTNEYILAKLHKEIETRHYTEALLLLNLYKELLNFNGYLNA